MSRRRVAIAVTATLVASGIVPVLMSVAFALDEPTAGCVTVSDIKGDASALGLSPNDPDLDITGLVMQATATSVVAMVKLDKLGANPATAPGRTIYVNFTSGGKAIQLISSAYNPSALGAPREAMAEATKGQMVSLAPNTYLSVAGSFVPTATVTAAFDIAKSRVAITLPRAQMNAAVPSFTDGSEITALTVRTANSYPHVINLFMDSTAAANAAAGTDKWVVGDNACFSSTPAPTGTASPSTAPSATPSASASASPSATPSPSATATTPAGPFEEAPYAFPRAGCALFTDAAGDGTATVQSPVAFQNDADLDISSVAVKTTATDIKALIKVSALGDKPANPLDGDRFEFEFKFNGKTFTYGVGRLGTVSSGASAPSPNRNLVNGVADVKLKSVATFDKAKSTVILAIERVALETVAGAPAPVGTVLTDVVARTKGYFGNRELAADSAQATAAADRVYPVGENGCFFPPPAKMEWLGDDTVAAQYGDLVEAAIALTSDDDEALVGRTVTFTLGTATVSAVTDADGVADAFLPALAVAPAKVIASFAGDADSGKSALPYDVTVTAEVTKLTLAVVKSGTKRTVTATLVDDDKPTATPVAGQSLSVLVNGKKVGTVVTDVKGKAAWSKALAGQTIKFTFAAVAGKYAASSVQQKLA